MNSNKEKQPWPLEGSEPQLITKGNPCLALGTLFPTPPAVDVRVITEENYQKLLKLANTYLLTKGYTGIIYTDHVSKLVVVDGRIAKIQ